MLLDIKELLRDTINENEIRHKEILLAENKLPLYPYQEQGRDFILNSPRCILGDDMGLGKTLQTIAAMQELSKDGRWLIVCPKGAKTVWEQELKKWIKAKAEVVNSADGVIACGMKFLQPKERFVICNYEQLKEFHPHITHGNWQGFIFDEAHKLRNKDTKMRGAVKELMSHFRIQPAIFITGTPLVNRPTDLWSLLNLIDQYGFSNEVNWLRQWFYIRSFGYKSQTQYVHKSPDAFQKHMSEYMIRRLRKDAIDLPKVQYIETPIELEGDQKRIYQSMKNAFLAEIGGKDAVLATVVIAQIMRLKQICLAPELITGAESCNGIKTEVLKELLEEHVQVGNNKIVIFSQFSSYLRALAKELTNEGYGVGLITGQVSEQKRTEYTTKFQDKNSDEVNVMLLTTKAGGESITLTAANRCEFMDLEWTPAANDQAFGRVYRIGQEDRVVRGYHKALNTVEQYIEELLHRKQNLFQQSIPVSFVRRMLEGD